MPRTARIPHGQAQVARAMCAGQLTGHIQDREAARGQVGRT